MQNFFKENAVIPNSFKTAKDLKEWQMWRKAIFTKLDSIIENGVFDIVPKEERDKTTGRLSTMQYILYHATQRKIKPRQADFVTAYTRELARSLIEELVYKPWVPNQRCRPVSVNFEPRRSSICLGRRSNIGMKIEYWNTNAIKHQTC